MTLSEIRAKLIELSGRRDLVDEYDLDNGANFFINGGERLLNSLVDDNITVSEEVLDEDTDENFWSYEHPDILIKAALYRLEVSYRNMAGAEDYLSSIMLDLRALDMKQVEADAAAVDEMEG